MRKVYFGKDNIITTLGFSTEENAENIRKGISGIRVRDDKTLYPTPMAVSSIDGVEIDKQFKEVFAKSRIKDIVAEDFSKLEKLFFISISRALENSGIDPADPRTIMIFSTTKGNIDKLVEIPNSRFQIPDLLTQHSTLNTQHPRLLLWEMAGFIARKFNCSNVPVVISNACTSGSVAIIQAARLISGGKYDHAVVTGGDIVSEFVISGFQSFQALSPEPCRPFDANRTGLSLGEGVGTVLMTADPALIAGSSLVSYLGSSTSNDANHISGPSRDGEGLYLSVAEAMREAGVMAGDISFISAHGTATPYNDEMESLALTWAGLENIPVNSFKGYIGHTLGAAGVIETILSIYSMRNNLLFKSLGFENNGVSKPLNIISGNIHQPVNTILKTASGFGGCNAALILTTYNPAL